LEKVADNLFNNKLCQKIADLSFPLKSAIVLLRLLLGVSPDVKVLLAVDEIVKFHPENAANNLSALTRLLDNDETLFLCVSVYIH
jgi:hypothetical protein